MRLESTEIKRIDAIVSEVQIGLESIEKKLVDIMKSNTSPLDLRTQIHKI